MTFNRLTFDPFTNDRDLRTLNVLRGYGGSRYCPSTALSQALSWYEHNPDRDNDLVGKRFLDIGCGDSRDWLFAQEQHMNAERVDLFPPRIDLDQTGRKWDRFWQADIVEGLFFPDNSFDIIIAQAMIDLVEPDSRIKVYREVARLLNPNGIFICYGQPLASGWGITPKIEIARLRTVFAQVVNYSPVWRCTPYKTNKYVDKYGSYSRSAEQRASSSTH